MTLRLEMQLEKLLDGALKSSDLQPLEDFLQDVSHEKLQPKCSKQFINKLDKLINRELDTENIRHASIGLTCLNKFGKTLLTQGGHGISGLVNQGLVLKMEHWFEKAKKLWVGAGVYRNEMLLTLAEDFLDGLQIVLENSEDGKIQVTESFFHSLCWLALDSSVNILIQKEAVRKLNVMLDKMPPQLKKAKKILLSKEVSEIMKNFAGKIIDAGDYDLQISLLEALFRMTTRSQRQEFASNWFSMMFVASAFNVIRDSEFETDCRKFLNTVNGMQGERRRVFSFPSLAAFLSKHELMMPTDEKLEKFWIDFNLGSQSISFYCTSADEEVQDSQWHTVCILENEVSCYTVIEQGNKKILHIMLVDVLCLSGLEGSDVSIHFSATLDIMLAVTKVYGTEKRKTFVGKSSTSVVKNTIQVILDEPRSPIVPESQDPQIATPARRKVSYTSTTVSSSGSYKKGETPYSCVVPASTPVVKPKTKPSLEMISSSERKKQYQIRDLRMTKTSSSISVVSMQNQSICEENFPVGKVDQVYEADPSGEIVADTQPCESKKRQLMACQESVGQRCRRLSVSEVLLSGNNDRSKRQYEPGSQPIPATLPILPDSCKRDTEKQKSHLYPPGKTNPVNLHVELTQRLEKLLMKESSEKESKRSAKNTPEVNMKAPEREQPQKVRKQTGRAAQTKAKALDGKLLASSELQGRSARRTSQVSFQESNIHQTPFNPDASLVRVTSLHEKKHKDKLKAYDANDSKLKKAKTAEVMGSMMTFIYSNYKNRAMPCWTPLMKSRNSVEKDNAAHCLDRDAERKSGFVKPSSSYKSYLYSSKDDVYNFRVDAPDREGVKQFPVSSRKSASEKSTKRSTSLSKALPKKPSGRNVKRHLFSDTDTDNKTDVSWLRDSARRPKSKVVDYSRHRPTKPTVPQDITYDSSDFPATLPKQTEKQGKAKKLQMRQRKTKQEKKAPTETGRPLQRPKRATAVCKSYRDPDSESSSQSDNETLPYTKNQRLISKKKPKDTDGDVQVKMKKKAAVKDPAWLQEMFASPCILPAIENMRCLKEPVVSPRSSISPLGSLTASPVGSVSPHVGVSRTHRTLPTFCGNNRTADRVPDFCVEQKSVMPSPQLSQHKHFYHTLSPVEPLLTSTAQQKLDRVSHVGLQHSENSPGLSLAFTKNSMSVHNPHVQGSASNIAALTTTLEKTPTFSPTQLTPLQHIEHHSGPCLTLKRQGSHLSSGTDNDEEDEDKENRPLKPVGNLKPRKLFKPSKNVMGKEQGATFMHSSKAPLTKEVSSCEDDEEEEVEEDGFRNPTWVTMETHKGVRRVLGEVSANTDTADRKMHSEVSSHMVSSSWGASAEGDMDMTQDLSDTQELGSVCHQFSSELKRKVQIRSRRLDLYTKHSLKTAEQHITAVSIQLHQHRTQKLESIKGVLLEEIQNLEQDDFNLKNLENELTAYWGKQCQAFHSLQEKDTRRLQHLRSTFQANVCHSTEYEDQIFSAEMNLMRKDMKAVQDKLFRDMHEEELLSVRRGLQALFLAGRSGF